MSQMQKTDYTRWRMLDEDGKHTWHYLDDEAVAKWPQTPADKYYLGLPLVCHLHNDPLSWLVPTNAIKRIFQIFLLPLLH